MTAIDDLAFGFVASGDPEPMPATGPAGDTNGVVQRLVDEIIPAVRERHNARRAEHR